MGRDHVEELSARRSVMVTRVEERRWRFVRAAINLKQLVQVRVVDEALPAERGPRLFEVDTHDEAQLVRKLGDGGSEKFRILARCLCVVNRAGADDHQQTRIL